MNNVSRSENGQSTVEYLGILAVVVALLGFVGTSDIGSSFAGEFSDQLCRVTQGDCGSNDVVSPDDDDPEPGPPSDELPPGSPEDQDAGPRPVGPPTGPTLADCEEVVVSLDIAPDGTLIENTAALCGE